MYRIASVIEELISWKLLMESVEKYMPIEMKMHLLPIIDALQTMHNEEWDCSIEWMKSSQTQIEACLDRTWEILNSGYWKDVSIEHRYCYSLCSIVKAILLEVKYEVDNKKSTNEEIRMLKSIIRQIDKGILLGAPLPSMSNLLTTIGSKINNLCNEVSSTAISSVDIIIDDNDICDELLPEFSPIKHYKQPSMESFYKLIFNPKMPAVLQGCLQHWRALKLWHNTDYLMKIAGNRTVPIEIGSRYTEEDWSQHLVTFSDFIQEHVAKSNEKTGYLAQHELFEQIPELKQDFVIPDYCQFSDNEKAEQPDINAWFGPSGTVSPLHFDPKNNLLCQVFGYKRIILYHPNDTPNLYPYDNRLLSNTASVDPINPDHKKWPNFVKAKGSMCYLKPGEILYIPPKWWHHVTALTSSFSVSFWWN